MIGDNLSKVRIVQSRPVYWTIDGGRETKIGGLTESFDFIHQKCGLIDRIRLIRAINEGLGLRDAKDIIEHHVQFVPIQN